VQLKRGNLGDILPQNITHFWVSMEHRGEKLRKAIDQSGLTRKAIYERLGIDRKTLYNKLNQINLDWDFITQVGKIINHDFSIEFPELRTKTYIVNEELSVSNEEDPEEINLPDCKKKLEQMRIKYIALFEKYTELLEKKAS
jgi:hypothetical protein